MPDYRAKYSHSIAFLVTITVIIGLSMTLPAGARQDTKPSSIPPSASTSAPRILVPVSDADLPDGRDLVEQAINAIGGREAFDQIKSMSIKGNMSALKLMLAVEIHTAQNGRYIYKISIPDGEVRISGSDGTVGWRLNPNTSGYELLDKSDLIENHRQANIHRILLQVEDRFSSIETISREDFGGTNAYKVRLATDDGKEQFMFFEVENPILLGVKIIDDQEQSFFMQFEDWETFGEVKLFRKMLLSRQGLVLETLFTEIIINETDPAIFLQPTEVRKLVAEQENDTNTQTPPAATQPDGTD